MLLIVLNAAKSGRFILISTILIGILGLGLGLNLKLETLPSTDKIRKAPHVSMAEPQYKDWKSRRYAELNVGSNPSSWIYIDSVKGKEDWYDKGMLKHIGAMAKKRGLEPLDAISIAISESQGGNLNEFNPMHLDITKSRGDKIRADVQAYSDKIRGSSRIVDGDALEYADNPSAVKNIWNKAGVKTEEDLDAEIRAGQGKIEYNSMINQSLDQLEFAQKRYGKGTRGFQAYSGTGKTIYGGDRERQEIMGYEGRAFGKSIGKTNFWKEMPQGKRVQAIKSAITKMPEFADETYE